MNYEYSIDELKACLRETARLWKRKVTPLDVSICEDLFLKYEFDSELILYLLRFAHQRGADTLKYLYPLADVLKKNGIQNRNKAELTLEKKFKKYMDILVYINCSKKVPSQAEIEKIDAIFERYAPTEEEIRCVGEITRQAKRPSLQYFEAVLKNKRERMQVSDPEVLCAGRKREEEDFEQIKQTVKKEAGLSDIAYNTWIRDLQLAASTDQKIEVSVPGTDRRLLHFIEKKYKGFLENAFRVQGIEKELMLRMN